MGGSSKPGNPNPHVGQTNSKVHPAQKRGQKYGSNKPGVDPHRQAHNHTGPVDTGHYC